MYWNYPRQQRSSYTNTSNSSSKEYTYIIIYIYIHVFILTLIYIYIYYTYIFINIYIYIIPAECWISVAGYLTEKTDGPSTSWDSLSPCQWKAHGDATQWPCWSMLSIWSHDTIQNTIFWDVDKLIHQIDWDAIFWMCSSPFANPSLETGKPDLLVETLLFLTKTNFCVFFVCKRGLIWNPNLAFQKSKCLDQRSGEKCAELGDSTADPWWLNSTMEDRKIGTTAFF